MPIKFVGIVVLNHDASRQKIDTDRNPYTDIEEWMMFQLVLLPVIFFFVSQ